MPPPFTQRRRAHIVDRSKSYGQPYSQDFREYVMATVEAGEEFSPHNQNMRQQHLFPNYNTCRRWEILQQELGHLRSCERQGNKIATVLRGPYLILLALFRAALPKATHPEINAFLYRCNFGNPNFRFYSHSQLSKAEKEIGMTMKRGSVTAYQAFLPVNVQKRWAYFNMAYPFGIADIRHEDMIDIDEAGFILESSNRTRGKAYSGVRVVEAGHYARVGDKVTLLHAICGESGTEENSSRRWRNLWLDGRTTIERFLDFIEEIIQHIGPGTPERRYCLLWII